MKKNLKLFAILAGAALVVACGDILSPTVIVTVTQTQGGSKKDPSTVATNPATAAACPIDKVEVEGPSGLAAGGSATMDATPYYKGVPLTLDCSKALPLRWTVLTPSTCELLGATATHNPTVHALGTNTTCELTFSQGGVALDAPFQIRIK